MPIAATIFGMSQGKVSKAGVPIVCLPHKLTVEIEGGDIDA